MDSAGSTIFFPFHTVKADGVLHPLRTILQFQQAVNTFLVTLHILSVAVLEFMAWTIPHELFF